MTATDPARHLANRLIFLKYRAAGRVETGAESTDSRYSAAMSPLRIAGFVLVALAALFGFANIYYVMTGTGGDSLSLYDVWYKFGPGSLDLLQKYMWSGLWNGLYIILARPAWVVVGILGLLFIGLGRKRVE